jgi:cysteinyl-tRNA synthetase|tara:strand:- start:242 stop:1642 length:1401 start_codon:yes stop_codon:yes gene_type:complete
MGKIKIFDTLSKSEKVLDSKDEIRIYLCGVTVYDDSHIGHARTIVVFDVLRRFIESKNVRVNFIQNFTDVDDKIIQKASEIGSSVGAVSKQYIDSYFDDFDKLNIKRATVHPKATEHIPEMINLISDLVTKDLAYETKNGVYFNVSKFPDYGKLSKKNVEDLESGARIEIDESKKSPLDFALWKFSETEPNWESPWGSGRPGWHIECSAMSTKYLGENFDIHGGGRDLIFPHHENEIAQSESFTGKTFAKIWMHAGMITINGEKMSKSLGNVKTVKHVVESWGPNIVRLFCLSGHYSKPIDYTEDLLKENLVKWRQLETCYYELRLADGEGASDSITSSAFNAKQKFDEAIESDFNTPLALTEFFNMVKTVNGFAADEKITGEIANIVMPILEYMLEILGLNVIKATDDEITSVFELIKKREECRKNKEFNEADIIRDKISSMGIQLVDHTKKTLWIKKEEIKADI